MKNSRLSSNFHIRPATFSSIAIILVFIALALRLVLSWSSLSNLPATSDEASVFLLAKKIAQGEFPLLFLGQPYQFPIESYLMAPFVDWLPRSAFGVRYQPLVFGLVSVIGFLLIARLAFARGFRWPAMLLILLPSAYLLVFTSAYAPPQYSISLTLAWLSIYAVLKSRESSHRSFFLMLAGLCCGLGVSNHLLSITVSCGVFAMILWGGSLRDAVRGSILFVAGFMIGAIPYFLALWLVPGAYENLPMSLSPIRGLMRLVAPTITEGFAGAMGVNPVIFPDYMAHLNGPLALRTGFALLFVLLFGIILLQRGKNFLVTVAARHWPKLEMVDLALITILLTFGLFAFHNTSSTAYRYLLPAVWVVPFLIGHSFQSFEGRWRVIIGVAVIVLASFNLATSGRITREWSQPGKIEKYSDTPPIDNLLKALEEKGITHCYASFWLAYRITFESDEEIICSLPSNERFPHWPVPYKEQVDNSSDAVYVLTQSFNSRLPTLAFKKQLRHSGIKANYFKVKPFFVFHDFRYPPAEGERILTEDEYSLETSSGRAEQLEKLTDGDTATAWRSSGKQQRGQWVQVNFGSEKSVSEVTVFHLPNASMSPNRFKIDGYIVVDGVKKWLPLKKVVKASPERLMFMNKHPVYNGLSQELRFDPTPVAGLRLEVVEPKENFQWGITELEIGVKEGDKPNS